MIKLILIAITLFVVTFGSYIVADNLSSSATEYVTIKPDENVECIVIVNMFNVAVDCWTLKPKQQSLECRREGV